ncbi:MAG: hypothetical protein KGY56_15005 [Desulfobacterales bacterium]|nr:hypothetical protein [Desulfobacterales bacterium]
MGTREKILVGLMIVALVYGAFELFISRGENVGQQQNSGPDIETARQMEQEINTRISQADLNAEQAYILEMASRQWQRDPFYVLPEQEDITEGQPETGGGPGKLEYTGYLEIGNTEMAIINGLEYRTGERLEQGGGMVRSISPGRVVVESASTGEKISVPYKD